MSRGLTKLYVGDHVGIKDFMPDHGIVMQKGNIRSNFRVLVHLPDGRDVWFCRDDLHAPNRKWKWGYEYYPLFHDDVKIKQIPYTIH